MKRKVNRKTEEHLPLDEIAKEILGGEDVGSPSKILTHALAFAEKAGLKVVKVESDFPRVTLTLADGGVVNATGGTAPHELTEYVIKNATKHPAVLEFEKDEPEPETEIEVDLDESSDHGIYEESDE